MGRVGEVIIRTWQTAHKMKVQRGSLKEDNARNDNQRAILLASATRTSIGGLRVSIPASHVPGRAV